MCFRKVNLCHIDYSAIYAWNVSSVYCIYRYSDRKVVCVCVFVCAHTMYVCMYVCMHVYHHIMYVYIFGILGIPSQSYLHYLLSIQAYHRGLVYPEYVWFISEGSTTEWWIELNSTNSSCLHSLVAKALHGSFEFFPHGFLLNEHINVDTLSGEVATYFQYS